MARIINGSGASGLQCMGGRWNGRDGNSQGSNETVVEAVTKD